MILKLQPSCYTACRVECGDYDISDRQETAKSMIQFTAIMAAISTLLLYLTTHLQVLASSNNAFKNYLESGAFEDTEQTNVIVDFVFRCVDKFLQTALPIMSICAITFTLLSLISTVLYLFRQDYFDLVYLAKKMARDERGKGVISRIADRDFKGIFSSNAAQQYGFFKTYICPNLKAWAFYEASEGPMTVADFFKQNFFKCIVMFSFCMLISDRTMLDLFYAGGEIGTYAFDKLAHDISYVEIIDDFVTAGSDYKSPWGTESGNTVGRNKTKVYNEVYKVLKSKATTDIERSTEFKAQMGEKLVSSIEDDLKTIPWSRKNFAVSASYIANKTITTDSTSERFYLPISQFGYTDDTTGYIGVYITSSEDNSGTVLKTTHEACWKVDSSSFTFDLSKEFLPQSEQNKVNANIEVTGVSAVRVYYKDNTTKTLSLGSNVSIVDSETVNGVYMGTKKGAIKVTPDNASDVTGISIINIDYTTWQTDSSNANPTNKYNHSVTANYKVDQAKTATTN